MEYAVYRKELKNKMRIISVPMKDTQIVSIGIFVKVGSRNETEDNNGISHFLEHMMFKGTRNYTSKEISEKLDSVGAVYNAATSYESTCYYINGHKKDVKLFIDILSDIYMHSLFDEKDMITEKKVVIEELNMYKDEPSDVINDMLHNKIFSNTALKYSILGTKENINSFRRKDLVEYNKRYYTPENTVVVITGDIKHKEIFKILEHKMGKNNNKNNNNHADGYNVKHNDKMSITVKEKKDIGQTNIIIAYKAKSYYSEEKYIYSIIAGILSFGFSSRLFELLRNKLGVAYHSSARPILFMNEGVFTINMGVDNKKVNISIEKVIEEINLMRNNDKERGVKLSELDKVKKQITTSFLLDMNSPTDYMTYYGSQELVYNNVSKTLIKDTLLKYEEITLDDVNRVMKDLFKKDNMNIFIYGVPPSKKNE